MEGVTALRRNEAHHRLVVWEDISSLLGAKRCAPSKGGY